MAKGIAQPPGGAWLQEEDLKKKHSPPVLKVIDALLGPDESLLSWNCVYIMLAW